MFGKYSILNSLDDLNDLVKPTDNALATCLVVLGESKIEDQKIFILPTTSAVSMQEVLLRTKPFQQVYIYGPKSYKFLIFAVMYHIYQQKNPRSRYIVHIVLEKLIPKLEANLALDARELTDMELQLKILFA